MLGTVDACLFQELGFQIAVLLEKQKHPEISKEQLTLLKILFDILSFEKVAKHHQFIH